MSVSSELIGRESLSYPVPEALVVGSVAFFEDIGQLGAVISDIVDIILDEDNIVTSSIDILVAS